VTRGRAADSTMESNALLRSGRCSGMSPACLLDEIRAPSP